MLCNIWLEKEVGQSSSGRGHFLILVDIERKPGSSRQSNSSVTLDRMLRQDPRQNLPCFLWARSGNCDRAACPFKHDPEIKAAFDAALQETQRQEAAKTLQQIVSGAVVTFSAGFSVEKTIPGFESCQIRVKGLPSDAQPEEICDLFTQQGIHASSFHLVNLRTIQSTGNKEANVIISSETGSIVAAGLDDIEFRDRRLTFDVGSVNGQSAMGALSAQDRDVLTVSWRAPACRYVANYDDRDSAQRMLQRLNGQSFHGRTLKVEMNQIPAAFNPSHFNHNSLKISNLPFTTTDDKVATLAHSDSVKRLKASPGMSYDLPRSLRKLLRHLEASGGLQAVSDLTGPDDWGKVSIKAQFASWELSQRARESLEDKTFDFIDNASFWLHLPVPLRYIITIPPEQYAAQHLQWDSLLESITDRKACNLLVNECEVPIPGGTKSMVRLRLSGSEKQAVGALKVRVESLAAGEKLDGWHPSFSLASNPFLLELNRHRSQVMVRADWFRHTLRVYGEPAAVQEVQSKVEEELERLSALEWTVVLKRGSIGFFILQGVQRLNETFGDETATLDITSSTLTIRGGDDVRHFLNNMIPESLSTIPISSTSNEICPVCYDQVSSPFPLGCGHIYCTPCLRHLLTSAKDTRNFPLCCLGSENTCGIPIPIPTIQRLISVTEFNHLLETVFIDYVEKHPNDLRFCKTPACTQLYRCTRSSEEINCPSCFSSVCSACHGEGHSGMTCEQWRTQNSSAEQERLTDRWMMRQGGRVKKCPSCNVHIEKLEGCNHMKCRCGAHVCWICLQVFTDDRHVYQHLNSVHGGIDDVGPVQQQVDYQEQLQVLAQAEQAHEAADRRRRQRAEAAVREAEIEARRLEEERRATEVRRRRREEAARQAEIEARQEEQRRAAKALRRRQQEEAEIEARRQEDERIAAKALKRRQEAARQAKIEARQEEERRIAKALQRRQREQEAARQAEIEARQEEQRRAAKALRRRQQEEAEIEARRQEDKRIAAKALKRRQEAARQAEIEARQEEQRRAAKVLRRRQQEEAENEARRQEEERIAAKALRRRQMEQAAARQAELEARRQEERRRAKRRETVRRQEAELEAHRQEEERRHAKVLRRRSEAQRDQALASPRLFRPIAINEPGRPKSLVRSKSG
ncbi:hypothetical protein C8J56DRAFT_889107 [Mycena floridula]|nr:hypothetical protein C8J56DRAFT_889107 [Mycena floridula]